MIVGWLIIYIFISITFGICAIGSIMTIIFERQEQEYGRVILFAIILLLSVIGFVMVTDTVFNLGIFDVFEAWIWSEI